MSRRHAVVFVLTLGLCPVHIACRKKASPAPSAAASSPTAAAPVVAVASASAGPSREGWDEPAVRKLVERWAAAQNQVDFAGYERLYAAKFSGVKRVGEATAWFGRKGWMRDRQPMFKQGLQVEATDVSVTLTSSIARVRFKQSFTLGPFHDEGRKELLVVNGPEGPLIAREEMLVSRVVGAKLGRDGGLGSSAVYAALEDSVYIGAGLGEEATIGAPVLSGAKIDPHVRAVERTVDSHRLAPALRALSGQTLDLVTADGPVCQARVKDFVVRASGEPHFGVVQEWRGADGTPPASDATIARDLWDMMGADKRFLIARLDKKCPNAIAAFESPAPHRIPRSTPSDAVKKLVIGALRKLPEYEKIQTEFDQGGPKGKRWDEQDARVEVTAFAAPARRMVVVVSATGGPNGAAGCGAFWGALSVRFEVDQSGAAPRITRTDVLESQDGLTPKFAIEGGGSLDILTGPDGFESDVILWRARPKAIEQETLFSAVYMDCPC
jgi:hypothetical protein